MDKPSEKLIGRPHLRSTNQAVIGIAPAVEPASVALVKLEATDGVVVGLSNELLVIFYQETPTMVTARAIDVVCTRAVKPLVRVAALIVISAASRAPESAVREATQTTMQRFEEKTDAVAYAMLGEGFAGAATRAVVTSILLFVRPGYPARVFPSVPNALKWLGPHLRPEHGRDQAARFLQIEEFCTPNVSASR